MAAAKMLNPGADVMGTQAALFMNINAAKGLLDVMKTNLGPRGTIKMLVGGSGGAPRPSGISRRTDRFGGNGCRGIPRAPNPNLGVRPGVF